MNNSKRNHSGDRKYRVLILLVVGAALVSSAIRELNQLQSFIQHASNIVAQVSDIIEPTATATVVSPACNSNTETQNSNQSDEFRWNGVIANGLAIEVKGINGEISAEPASGNEVQVVAIKRSRKSDVNMVQIKVTQHAGGVTICALYPNEDGLYPNDCSKDGDDSDQRRGDNSGRIKNNDVRVDFQVRVPRDVNFFGRTINGEVRVNSLSSNARVQTINGSIKISTSGYAEASTINGSITAKLGDSNWSKALSFKTINGEISLELPSNLGASVDAQTLNGSINSDFPLTVISQSEDRKRLKGTIGAGGRSLSLKTLNGSINLRIAG